MIKYGKFLTIKKEGSANQSEGCDARRKAQYGPPAALCKVQNAKRCTSHLAGAALFSFCLGAFHRETGSIDD